MKISPIISSTNFRGIKISNSLNPIANEQEKIYQDMTDSFNELARIADEVVIKSRKELEQEARKECQDQLDRDVIAIRMTPHMFFENTINEFRVRRAKKKAEKTTAVAIQNVDTEKAAALKLSIVEDMQRILEEGLKKIEKLDETAQMIEEKYSAIRGAASYVATKQKDSKGFAGIAGYDYEKKVLSETFITSVLLEREGINAQVPGAVLFFGPYNNGKTYMAQRVAQESDCHLVKLRKIQSELNSKGDMGRLQEMANESEKRFQETGRRTIIFIDELDKIINSVWSAIELEEFMSTCSELYHCTIFATTNFPSNLKLNFNDPNIFPIRISIDAPDDENLKKVLQYYLSGIVQKNIDYDKIVQEIRKSESDKLGVYSNAQIRAFPMQLAEKYCHDNITQSELISFIHNDTKPSVSQKDLKRFEDEYKYIIGG